MIFLEIKYDHQGFTVVIGCEFCTLWGEEGMHDIKGEEIRAIRLHTDCMYSEMLPYKKMLLHVATSFSISVPQ